MSGRWRYAEQDVQARVETLRRGDRVYLPRGGGRVVSHVELYPATEAAPGVPARPAQAVVVYFTGERAKPLRPRWRPDETGRLVPSDEPSDEPRTLVTASLAPVEQGTRLRARRAVAAPQAAA